MHTMIRDASAATPDPARSQKNLERLLDASPDLIEGHSHQLPTIARLCAYSQFLSDYCVNQPRKLAWALEQVSECPSKPRILAEIEGMKGSFGDEINPDRYRHSAMKLLRTVKKDFLLAITLRDISGMADLRQSMRELSTLAEALLEGALDVASTIVRRRFGLLRQNAFCVIGMGKLGASELNYSSDVDIMTVYRTAEGSSTGTLNPFGIRQNTISAHEYQCALTETLSALLHAATEDGIAYRVDLRLRPNGQKGALSLDLDSYRAYYEAWGKTWERLALIRARPVAGDIPLGDALLRVIEPFVWKRSADYDDIEEIKSLKKKIDSIADVNDLKRGYGGIREIEFFLQTFQLLYGGEKKNLRERSVFAMIEELKKERFLSADEATMLSDSYRMLRRIEHVLQMRDDLQTCSLPTDEAEVMTLAAKMHFPGAREFLTKLKIMRLAVRDMYHALLGGTDAMPEILLSAIDELPDNALEEYLAFKGFRDPFSALKEVRALGEQVVTCKTLRERTLLRKTIPLLLEQTMQSARKDRGLVTLLSFIEKIGHHASYLELLLQSGDSLKALAGVFSSSTYLSHLLLSLDNLEAVFEYPDARAHVASSQERLVRTLGGSADPVSVVRDFKNTEEMKLGMLFLRESLDVSSFQHRLSMLADVIIRAIVEHLAAKRGFAVVGLGGYGARSLNIGSDLDLLFISEDSHGSEEEATSPKGAGFAEDVIRFLAEYTAKGYAYRIDMRLRPDGSRGILVRDIRGYAAYYASAARPWEVQSLLRARPVAGDMNLLRSFMRLRRECLVARGNELRGTDMRQMRARIVAEIAKESAGLDLKNGPGGIKEVEFFVQYLQMKHAARGADLIVHDTESAFQRLVKYAILDGKTASSLVHSYRFLKTVDTLLRLNEEDVVRSDAELLGVIASFLRIPSHDLLLRKIGETRQKIAEITNSLYEETT